MTTSPPDRADGPFGPDEALPPPASTVDRDTAAGPDGSSDRDYVPLFDPDRLPADQPFDPSRAFRFADRPAAGAPAVYVFEEPLVLAINVALATGRPLLLRGHPGTGKTSLARYVAGRLGWRFYGTTISSRTTARDLQWRFDTVARLADAELGKDALRPLAAYLTPGPLWWAFHPGSAGRRGLSAEELAAADTLALLDPSELHGERAVVLIDEIDKADPDVPNDLLVPLGSLRFQVDDGPLVEAEHPPLVIITTNEERDLPRAFLRRCVVHTLEQPNENRLRDIARAHAGHEHDDALFDAVYAEYVEVRRRRIDRHEPPPSVAEFLDVLAACRSLGTAVGDGSWPDVVRVLLDKAMAIPPEQAVPTEPVP